ncbi:hypothetical protein [Bacillus sp. FJAT-29814]|uniref:hypothetical protein n=1 Tax=Bacillus sp. FJAT-29814 TaxID=1729688 RepID=UPI00082D556F|nr:hypothetical protein [Bacillus sp. FJAT-29814]
MENKMTVHWYEISDIVEEMLWGIGWSNDTKLLWAEKAWKGIVKQDLANYCNDLDRHMVYIRLFTIVVILGEFHSKTMEQAFYPNFNDWMEEFELSPIRIGQLVGDKFGLEEYDNCNLIESAFSVLVERAKNEVLKSLCKEFAGINSLFVGLWLTYENFKEDINDEDDEFEEEGGNKENNLNLITYEKLINENIEDVLNYDTSFTKLEAYSWLLELK